MSQTNESNGVFRHVRDALGITQREMAIILGLSDKAIQSYEQGWRKTPESVFRTLNVVYVTHRLRNRRGAFACWKARGCPAEMRKNCRTFKMGAGHLCWLVSGNKCNGQEFRTFEEKNQVCQRCKVYRQLGIVHEHASG